jgi:hypothetical protein
MAHRFTNTEKWQDTWFSDLSPTAKLVFMFLCENCDNAGVYEINKKFMLFLTGLTEEQLKNSITELSKSYLLSKDKKSVWLKGYLKHQKKLPLNPKNNSHKQVILILEEMTADADRFKSCKEMVKLIPVTDKPKTKRATSTVGKQLVKPSVQEVESFMVQKDFKVAKSEAERFWNWFESNGWKVGRNPMKNWKGAVNTWIANWYDRNHIKPKVTKLDNVRESHENLDEIDWNKVYPKEEVKV